MSPTCRLEKITPQKARKLLEQNKRNRSVRESYILELATAMEAGEWVTNGESIKIDTEGNLADGQHRLHAVVLSGVTIEVLVVRNVSPEAFDTIDRGRLRTIGDVLHRNGHVDCNAVASALWWLNNYSCGTLHATKTKNKISPARALELLEKHADIKESMSHTRQASKAKILPPGIGIFCHYLFSRVDSAKADEFFLRLADGTGLRKTQAVYQLRERLIANRGSKAKLNRPTVVAMCLKAWKHATNGDSVKQLKVHDTEDLAIVVGMEPSKV